MNKTIVQSAIDELSPIISNLEKKDGHSSHLLEQLRSLKMQLLDDFFKLSKPAPKKKQARKPKTNPASEKVPDQAK